MHPELKELVKEAYSVFGTYRLEPPLEACTFCCVSPEEEAHLFSMPLRNIEHGPLYAYCTGAKTDSPLISQFKYFLPRVMEFLCEGNYPHYDLEISLFGSYGQHFTWTENEEEFMGRFALKFFSLHLRGKGPYPHEALLSILVLFGLIRIDMEPMILHWLHSAQPEALLHWADFILGGYHFRETKLRKTSFADEFVHQQLHVLLEKQDLKGNLMPRFEAIILNPEGWDEHDLDQLNWAYEALFRWHRSMP